MRLFAALRCSSERRQLGAAPNGHSQTSPARGCAPQRAPAPRPLAFTTTCALRPGTAPAASPMRARRTPQWNFPPSSSTSLRPRRVSFRSHTARRIVKRGLPPRHSDHAKAWRREQGQRRSESGRALLEPVEIDAHGHDRGEIAVPGDKIRPGLRRHPDPASARSCWRFAVTEAPRGRVRRRGESVCWGTEAARLAERFSPEIPDRVGDLGLRGREAEAFGQRGRTAPRAAPRCSVEEH